MKQEIIAVPSESKIGAFHAACSLSGHQFKDQKTGLPLVFESECEVEGFGRFLLSESMTVETYRACVIAMIKQHGAVQRPSGDRAHNVLAVTFDSLFGPAELDLGKTDVTLRFLDPDKQAFPWGSEPGQKGVWHFRAESNRLREQLVFLAEGLALCTSSVGKGSSRTVLTAPEVMRSGAGYYVGCYSITDGLPSPHSRFSDYWPKPEKAQIWLEKALSDGSL